MKQILGIIGGMGPLATVDLFKKIVTLTDAECDQDHLHVLIDNNTGIPDRTAFLMGRGIDPRSKLVESAKRLQEAGANCLIMPCNTAHYFYDDIVKEIDIEFLNMIGETAKFLSGSDNETAKIGLLATEGTCKTGVYDSIFSTFGLNIEKPSEDNQKHVTDLIYGIKEGKKNIDISGFYEAVEELGNKGCEIFILGCTELSVAHEMFNLKGNFVDPLEIVAISAIKFCGKNTIK
jgi:aspartate racemase